MSWNLEGMRLVGKYMGSIPISGVVELSRVQYGGTVSHHVVLDQPVEVYGAVRDRVIIENKYIDYVEDVNFEDSRYDDQFELDSDYN